jgi:Icc-related predicted phosphoesterase
VTLFRRSPRAPHTRVFFATDLHGSERCFRKWLNAAAAYEAHVLILGGDLTGKMLVPLVADGAGGHRGELHGEPVHARDADALEELMRRIRMLGRYPVVVTAEEHAAMEADPAALEARFTAAMGEGLRAWVELADERLAGSDVAAYTMLGNDDAPALADVLRGAERSTYAEDGIVELPGGFEMASFGYSTPTPWHTPRELEEGEMAARLDELIERLSDPGRAVLNLHCPPAATHLDQAAKLDDGMRPVVDASGIVMTSVGSTAVRAAIERHQPLLGLHGHVHESPGSERLGTTLCVNPGSDYGDGVLRGAIVDLEAERGVARWQLVQG